MSLFPFKTQEQKDRYNAAMRERRIRREELIQRVNSGEFEIAPEIVELLNLGLGHGVITYKPKSDNNQK